MPEGHVAGVPRKNFLLRLALSLFLVPVIPPAMLFLESARVGGSFRAGDWSGILLLYGVIGVAAMLVLGMPLLFCLLALGRTGFISFIVGGGVCAGIPAYVILSGVKGSSSVAVFIIAGAVSGLVFRLILFGRGRKPVTAEPGGSLRNSSAVKGAVILCASSFVAVTFVAVYYLSDEHRSVSEQMGWQCTGVADTQNPGYSHVESVRLWFLKNPRYEVDASGPNLCAGLESVRQSPVMVTFDVWGSRTRGLHGYDGVSIAAGGRQFKTYGFESGGYHDDTPHYGNYNSANDLAAQRFPLDVFRHDAPLP